MFSQFHFIRPNFLLILIPIFLLMLFQYLAISKNNYEKFIKPHLLKNILLSMKRYKIFSPLNINLSFIALICICAAGPTYKRVQTPFSVDKSKLVIALSLAESMEQEDVLPNRYKRAQLKILELLKGVSSQVAIVMFSQDAFVALPYTRDKDAISPFVKAAAPIVMPSDGNRVSSLLDVIPGLFKKDQDGQYLMIIADEADTDSFTELKNASIDFNFNSIVYGVGLDKDTENSHCYEHRFSKKISERTFSRLY